MTLLAAHFVAAMAVPLLTRLLGQRVFFLLAAAPAAATIWLATLAPTILAGDVVTFTWQWIPTLGVNLSIRIGILQWVMGLIVSSIGAIVLAYCPFYFAHDPPQARVAGILTAFAGAMLGLVIVNDLIALYIFWELTTVFSYLLVGHNPLRAANRTAAMSALIVTTFGGLAMLVGIIIVATRVGTFSLADVLATGSDGSAAFTIAILLMVLGAVTKSAQVPFHFWLPGAMAAPTPVSAYLHAAAMVKAGVYLIAVLSPVFATTPGWRPILMAGGAITMILGGWRALRQHDIKLLLAYGTVSQLGFLMSLSAIGTQAAALGAISLVISHALFKSALFLTVGVVDHTTGTRDLRELTGVGKKMPVLAAAAALAGASMAGFPPLIGFVAKESALTASLGLLSDGGDGTGLLPGPALLFVVAIVVGSVLTVAYTLRFWWGAFATKPGGARPTADDAARGTQPTIIAPSPGFVFAPIVLAVASLVAGVASPWLSGALELWSQHTPVGHQPHQLGLWHGFVPALWVSIACWIAGAVLFWQRDWFSRLQETFPETVTAKDIYLAIMRGLDRAAVEVTARYQRGSLPGYLGSILVVLVLTAGGAWLASPVMSRMRLWDGPAQAIVVGIVVVAAILAATSRGRLKAVILAGTCGYGVAMLFLLHGAPDLALTQVLVETVSIVVFVLVLRKLPKYFTDRPLHSSRWWRLAVATTAGLTLVGATVLAATSRIAEPVSNVLPETAYTFGHGRNIVNVVLVDTRAWDTLGEITVVVVAATGIASLIFVRGRFSKQTRVRTSLPTVVEGTTWLRGGAGLSAQRRALVLEVMTRLLFPIMMLVSFYLLLAGHNSPGGGFAGGLVAGTAILIRYLAGGRYELEEAAPIDAGRVLGGGIIVAGLSALAPVPFGGKVLESYAINIHIPYLSTITTPWGPLDILGNIHFVTSTIFDIGVFLVVIGLMLDIARSLGSGIDIHEEEDRAPSPSDDSRGNRGRPTAPRLRRRHLSEVDG